MAEESKTEGRLLREVANLKENLQARLDEMQRAVELTQKFPTLLDRAVDDIKLAQALAFEALDRVRTERRHTVDMRFDNVQIQFQSLDRLIAQARDASKEAVTAAFKAAGDASQLQAQQAKESINNLTALFSQSERSTSDKVNALDRRLTTIEGRKEGGATTIAYIVAAIGAFATVLTIVGSVIVLSQHATPPATPLPNVIYLQPPAGASATEAPPPSKP